MDALATLPDDAFRLLKLLSPRPPDAPPLVPVQATLREALDAGFELVLEALTPAPAPELQPLVGQALALGLLQADGRYTPWHGCVAEAAQLGRLGGLALVRLVLRPWLAALALRRDSYVFEGRTALEIVQEVFADYPAARWRVECSPQTLAALPRRALCLQYRESDLAFVSRLLAREGLHGCFEHEADGAGAAPRHVLVIGDAERRGRDLGALRLGAQHPTAFEPGREDPVTHFMARQRAVANAVALGGWDAQRLAGIGAEARSARAPDGLPLLEHYEGTAAPCADGAAARREAERLLWALELDARRFEGRGGVRRLGAGACFRLAGTGAAPWRPAGSGAAAGPGRGDAAFTVLAVEHRVANNLGPELARLLARRDVERGTYRNRFQAVPLEAPIVPRRRPAPPAPSVLGARVVGLSGQALHSDREHRVKVQFHFQRGRCPNPGGLPHLHGADPEGHAPGHGRGGAWLRVLGSAAGANWGSVFTPRVGAEVAVAFEAGDLDRPVVAGGLYHGADAPPFAAGEDSGMNHAGALSGLQSRRVDGGGFNQWVLDDTRGQLRLRLLSSPTDSELGLGHLIRQGADGWRGAWRGAGFEAHTQGWSTLRAGRGLLLSTQRRPGTYGSAQGAQMDAAEAIAQLQAARELGRRLGSAARAVQAQGFNLHLDGQALWRFLRALDPRQDGRHPETVNRQPARQPGPDGRTPGALPVPAFAVPALVLDGAAAALLASGASVSAWAGQGWSLTAQGDLHASATAWTQAGGGTASVYAHQGGLRAVAAQGPVSLRAHADGLRVLADGPLSVVSVNGEIHVCAQRRVRFVGGASSVTLDGMDIEFATPGRFLVKGAVHEFAAGRRHATDLPVLPSGATRQPTADTPLDTRYSEALDLSAMPDAWLPWSLGALAKAYVGREALASLGRQPGDQVAGAVMTQQPQAVSYWLQAHQGWRVEEAVEQPDDEGPGHGADSEGEDDE